MERGRALVVDGSAVQALAIDRQLDALGWDALVVNSGGEALGILDMAVALDAVLIDAWLPDLSGESVAEVARQLAPAARIILMCPSAPSRRPEWRVLLKPFSTRELEAALGRQPR